MIQQLREQSQSLFFRLLLGFIAVTFVISFGVGSFFGDSKDVLAVIDSDELLAQEFQKVYSQSLENFRRQFGTNADQFAEQLNLRQQVFNQMIDQRLQIAEANRQGIKVSDEEIQSSITSLPYFQKDGQFDFATYRQVLQQARITTDEFEKQRHTELLTQKYQNALISGIVVSDLEVEQTFRLENEKYDIDYVYFDPKVFLNKAEYSDEELQKYYEENTKEFESNKQFQIEYFVLTLGQLRQSAVVKEREITRYYEKNQEDFSTLAEVKISNILIKSPTGLSDDEKAAKKKLAEDILDQLKGGANFEELVTQYSEDFSKDNKGDLGWFKTGEMLAGLEQPSFELDLKQISDVVESSFGFHIIRLDDKKPEVVRSLEEVRTEITDILKDKRAEKKLELEYSRLLDRMEEKNDIGAIAESFNSQLVKTSMFDKQSTLQGIGSTQTITNQLDFESEGEYGRLKRNPVQGYVYYKLLKVQEPETKPFDEVKTEIVNQVKAERAQELANKKAKEESSKTLDVQTLVDIAKSYQLKVQKTSFTANASQIPDIGLDPEFKKQVLLSKSGQKYGFSENMEGRNVGPPRPAGKAYLFVLTGSSLPEDSENEKKKEQIRNQIQQKITRAFNQKDSARLRAQADIQIVNDFFKNEVKL